MKKTSIIAAVLLAAVAATAQTNSSTFIRGTLDIQYNTKASDSPAKGVKDVYKLNVNVDNSALFHGTISDLPQIMEGYFSKSVTQPRSVYYDLAVDLCNPRNPAQTKNVGRLYGPVPINSDGVYNYDSGALLMDIIPIGSGLGLTSKFAGNAAGKPMNRPVGWLDKLQRQAVSITRSVNGKTMTVVLKKYDKMEFRQTVLAAGPVQIYSRATLNGELLYDYDKNCWFFNNVTVQYEDAGTSKSDRLAGTIRWVEDPNRKVNGLGEYQFDVRVNEPQVSEAAAFDAKPSDESAFFDTDTKIPGLSGTMKYKDTLRGDDTLASSVMIDLTGNNLSKQQTMVLFKTIILASVVPMNSD